MKTCPFCKAEIEDTARFCLYCMSSLTEKEIITRKKHYRWLTLLAAAVLVLAASMIGVGFALGQREIPEPSYGLSMEEPDQTGEQTLPPEVGQITQTQPEDVPATTDAVSTGGEIPNRPVSNTNISTAGTKPPVQTTTPATTEPATKPPATESTTPSTTVPSTVPPATTAPEQTEATTEAEEEVEETTYPPDYGNGIPGSEGYRTQYSIRHSDPVYDGHVPFNDGKYCLDYARATAEDLMDPSYVNTEGDRAVSGNYANARNGIYTVASYDNGGKVVAICNAQLGDVVKLIVPETVVAIGSHALYNNYEFKYLCLQGDMVTIHPDAFPPLEKRWYTIVIRCSAACKNSDGEYIKDIVGEYGAVWEEWDGTE